jgi:hypothetical protein
MQNLLQIHLFMFLTRVEGPEIVLFFSLKWLSRMERTLKANFCFALVCKLVVEVQKVFLFICVGWPPWREHERESLVWFSWQRVCGGPTKFYSLHLHGCATCTKS